MNTEIVASVNAFITLIINNISDTNSKNYFTLTVGPNMTVYPIHQLREYKLSQVVALYKSGKIKYHSEII